MADHRDPGRPVRATTLVVTRSGGQVPAPAPEMVEYTPFPARDPFGTSVLRRRRTLILAVLVAMLSVAAYAFGPVRPPRNRPVAPPAAQQTGPQLAPDGTTDQPATEEGVAGAGSASASASPAPSKASPTAASAAPAVGNTAPAGPRNVAAGAAVEASSVEAPHLAPSNAIDGNGETRWGSGFADPQWIKLDLGNQYPLGRVAITWERAYATRFQVEVSGDGNAWKKVYETANGNGGTTVFFATGNTSRYVKITGLARISEYGYSIIDIAVFTA
ncbi:discoidin domain-containing protein [Virgisporangium aliadipatigenens]|nr:discoidin domain-containing protein [Virgisporangium aliadipatigenens]